MTPSEQIQEALQGVKELDKRWRLIDPFRLPLPACAEESRLLLPRLAKALEEACDGLLICDAEVSLETLSRIAAILQGGGVDMSEVFYEQDKSLWLRCDDCKAEDAILVRSVEVFIACGSSQSEYEQGQKAGVICLRCIVKRGMAAL